MFKDENTKEPERMNALHNFIEARQSECENDPNLLTRAWFSISLGRLYIDIGMLSEAKVSCECAKVIITPLLPQSGETIPDDIQEVCDEWHNLSGELEYLEPREN